MQKSLDDGSFREVIFPLKLRSLKTACLNSYRVSMPCGNKEEVAGKIFFFLKNGLDIQYLNFISL